MTNCSRVSGILLLIGVLSNNTRGAPTSSPPDEWIDKDTGHKVIRLSRREGQNRSCYFHQNVFTAAGDKMVFIGSTPNGPRAFTVELKTLKIRQITSQPGGEFEIVAPRRRELFYLSGDTVMATHLDTLETRKIAGLPSLYKTGRGFALNSDETTLAGCYAEGEAEFHAKYPWKESIQRIYAARLSNALCTVDIAGGRVREFYKTNEWLGHVQFSPNDPGLLMFCHEGPAWAAADRIWLVRTDGTGLRKLRGHQVRYDLMTHEFWAPDGRSIWFDLQIRRPPPPPGRRPDDRTPGHHYYLANLDIAGGNEVRYELKPAETCWHFNVAPDGKRLCGDGDGRDPRRGGVGNWIYLFTPEDGRIKVERLCSMARHNWSIPPHSRFTPDGKWVVFTSSALGISQVYAVEVRRQGT
jgi:oligogalacturonide lyase